jgi:predicted metalloprotease
MEEGLKAAAAIGDDRMQRMSGRGVNPDAFTHGSSQQRVQWFRTGLQTGRVDDCNTFAQLER